MLLDQVRDKVHALFDYASRLKRAYCNGPEAVLAGADGSTYTTDFEVPYVFARNQGPKQGRAEKRLRKKGKWKVKSGKGTNRK